MGVSTNEYVMYIKDLLYTKINHPFLLGNIEKVDIDETELALIACVLRKTDASKEKVLHYIITLMLIQLALDTHERVLDEKGDTKTSRQLTVLAGDYFSGLYYDLLAKENDVQLISTLSEGIKEVNEHKIALYIHKNMTFSTCMGHIEAIEATLLSKVCTYLNLDQYIQMASKLFLLNRLERECQQIEETGTSMIGDIVGGTVDSSVEGILSMVQQYAQKERQKLKGMIKYNEEWNGILNRIYA